MVRDPDAKPALWLSGRGNSMPVQEKRCQSCGCRMWIGEHRCPLCDAPVHFAWWAVSTHVPADEALEVVVLPLGRGEPAVTGKWTRITGSRRRRSFGQSHSSVAVLVIRVALATAVVAALLVAGMNLL